MQTSALTALTQLLIFSLIVERIVQVFQLILGWNIKSASPDESTWGWSNTVCALIFSYALLWYANYKFLSELLGDHGDKGFPPIEYLVGAIVSAGGSSGIRKIMDAISTAAKASTEQSKAKLCIAQLERKEALNAIADVEKS